MMIRRWIVLLLVAFVLGGCASPPAIKAEGEIGGEYRYSTIDGMPCLVWRSGIAQNSVGGITCDWTRWDGMSK